MFPTNIAISFNNSQPDLIINSFKLIIRYYTKKRGEERKISIASIKECIFFTLESAQNLPGFHCKFLGRLVAAKSWRMNENFPLARAENSVMAPLLVEAA